MDDEYPPVVQQTLLHLDLVRLLQQRIQTHLELAWLDQQMMARHVAAANAHLDETFAAINAAREASDGR